MTLAGVREGRGRRPQGAPLRSGAAILVLEERGVVVVALTLGVGCSRAAEVRGLPFIRAYSLDEIGKVPRGARIGFDSVGRFAVMYDGTYAVLNNTAWVDRIDAMPANRTLMTTIRVLDGTYYYGGHASWGIAEPTREGNLRARSLVPPDAPAWTTVTPFNVFRYTANSSPQLSLGSGLI